MADADVDEYNSVDQVRVEMWVLANGQSCSDCSGVHKTIRIGSDDSVSTQDNADGQGVDAFNAGNNNQLQALGVTIYNGTRCFAVLNVRVARAIAAKLRRLRHQIMRQCTNVMSFHFIL